LNSSRKTFALLAVLSVCFCLLYLTRTQTVVYGYDPLGYLYAGQRLAEGGPLSFPDANNALAGSYFAPFAFNIVRPGETDLYLNYPPGLPLLLALAQRILGSASAPFFVTPIAALAGVLATFWLGKLLFGNLAGLIAAMLLAMSPLYFTFSTDLWSDVPASACILVAMALYVSSTASENRHAGLRTASAGLLLGYAVFIRYASVVFVLPIVLYGLMVSPGPDIKVRRNLPFLGAFVLTMIGLLLFNRAYYGGFLATAYSPRAGWYPWPAFSLAYALGPSPVGGRSLIGVGMTILRDQPVALLFGVLGLLAMKRSSAALIGGTTLMVLGLYSCYAFTPTGINARFLLPAVAMICLAAAAGLEWVRSHLGGWKRRGVLLPITVIGVGFVLFRPTIAAVERRALDTSAQIRYVQRMTEATPQDAVFMSYVYNDLVSYYGHRSVLNYRRIPPVDADHGRYEMEALEPCLVAVVGRLLHAGRPVYYVEDKTPPFWDSLAILQRHFVLRQTQNDPKVFQVTSMLDAANQGDISSCRR
jgi:hypothetical protein